MVNSIPPDGVLLAVHVLQVHLVDLGLGGSLTTDNFHGHISIFRLEFVFLGKLIVDEDSVASIVPNSSGLLAFIDNDVLNVV